VVCCAVSHLDTNHACVLAGCLPWPPLAASLTSMPADTSTLRGTWVSCTGVWKQIACCTCCWGCPRSHTQVDPLGAKLNALTGVWSLMRKAWVSVDVCIAALACKEMVGLASARQLGAGRRSGSCWVFWFCSHAVCLHSCQLRHNMSITQPPLLASPGRCSVFAES
jgi:hypothetical protein